MTRLLTFIILITLIGLNLFSCDPKESFYIHSFKIVFRNSTEEDVRLVFHSLASVEPDSGYVEYSDTIIFEDKIKDNELNYSVTFDDSEGYDSLVLIERTVNGFYDDFNDYGSFDFYISDSLVKTWMPPLGYFGDSVKNPYNFDSWDFIEYDVVERNERNFIHGEIIFEITSDFFE